MSFSSLISQIFTAALDFISWVVGRSISNLDPTALDRRRYTKMATTKQTFDIQLNTDQMAFIRSMKEKYEIADESKTFRVIIDYLMVTRNVHDAVFRQSRCFRCD